MFHGLNKYISAKYWYLGNIYILWCWS